MRQALQLHSRWIKTIVLVSGVLIGCSGGSADARRPPTVAGGEFEFIGETNEIAIDTLFELGLADGPREYAFGRIDAVLPRPDYGFYTCDGQDGQLRLYDATGKFVAPIGRSGAGPGEYDDCRSMMLNPQGDIVVNDVGNGRLVIFEAAGTFRRVQPWVNRGSMVVIDPVGRTWAVEYRAGRGGDERSWNVLFLRDERQVLIDSLTLPSLRLAPNMNVAIFGTDDGVLSPRIDDTLWSVLPNGGVLVAASVDSTVKIIDTTLTPRALHAPIARLGYSDSERHEWERLIARTQPQPVQPLPATKPRIRDLRGDELDRIWIRVADTAYRSINKNPVDGGRLRLTHLEQGVWDLLQASTGHHLGRLRLPIGHRILASYGDRIWLTGFGDDGQQVLLVVRMQRQQRLSGPENRTGTAG